MLIDIGREAKKCASVEYARIIMPVRDSRSRQLKKPENEATSHLVPRSGFKTVEG